MRAELTEHSEVYVANDINLSTIESDVDNRHILRLYIRDFTREWNAFLERDDCMTSEVYREGDTICIKFIPVKRDPKPPQILSCVNSLGLIKSHFPDLDWSNPNLQYCEVDDQGIYVIQRGDIDLWTFGVQDANNLIHMRFINTLPKEWKNNRLPNMLIENKGKIKYAALKLRGITVLTGENNTGKSTICKEIHKTESTASYLDPIYITDACGSTDFDITEKMRGICRLIDEVIPGDFSTEETDEHIGVLTYAESGKSPLEYAKYSEGLKVFLNVKYKVLAGLLKENDTLIIDGLETLLHPNYQVRLAEIIVLMQKILNLKIVMVVNSPYFLRAIQVFSAKHKIYKERCNFYHLVKGGDGFTNVIDCTEDTDEIYQEMGQPFSVLDNIWWSLDEEEE